MDRYWLLTWTTYGSWLPGDARGSVASVRNKTGPRIEHDQPGIPVERTGGGISGKIERGSDLFDSGASGSIIPAVSRNSQPPSVGVSWCRYHGKPHPSGRRRPRRSGPGNPHWEFQELWQPRLEPPLG